VDISSVIENRILSEAKIRDTYLKIFADSILYATEDKSGLNWTVHHENQYDYLRFTVGQNIVCSIENNSIWLALCAMKLESKPLSMQQKLDASREWEWGPEGTLDGEYTNKNFRSRNGYYKLGDNAQLTPIFADMIWPLHLEFLDKVTKKNYPLRKKKDGTINYTPELLDYIEQHIQHPLSRPRHDALHANWPPPQVTDIHESNGPERVVTKQYRILRDTKIAAEIKQLYEYQCQICPSTSPALEFPNGQRYAEAHHIKPLGQDGPDERENIMCVCPNCHALLDYAALELDIDKIELHDEHKINQEYIDYHNEQHRQKFE